MSWLERRGLRLSRRGERMVTALAGLMILGVIIGAFVLDAAITVAITK